MAVTGAASIFGFGAQAAKDSVAASFFRHRATVIDLGVNDDIRVGPQEVGGGVFPTFPYKAGYVVTGGVEMQPRLEDSLGWMLYAMLGDVSTGSPVDGVYPHTFKPLASDLSYVRWMTLRKYIPKKEGDEETDLGEEYMNCKPLGCALTLANDAPLTARWDFEGMKFRTVPNIGAVVSKNPTGLSRTSNVVTVTATAHGFQPGNIVVIAGVTPSTFNGTFAILTIPTADTFTFQQIAANATSTVHGTAAVGENWTWENTYEDWGSIPVGCELGGYVKFTGGGLTDEELPVVGGRVMWANQPLPLREEKVYGSPELEDITVVQRMVSFDLTVKWNNPKLLRAIQSGHYTGAEWSSRPLVGEMEIAAVATALAGTSLTQKHQLTINAPEMMWQMNGPIAPAAGTSVLMRFTGTGLEPSAGDYATFLLQNEVASYVWP